jgi:transcriptional regulator with XRE-family HTH domain
MLERLAYLNGSAQAKCLDWRNDLSHVPWYLGCMAAPRHDWYLKQWLRTLHKKQADLERDLGLNKAKVSLTANGKQPYDRDLINVVADYLNLRPFELLMHPDDAMSLRRLREDAIRIAHSAETTASADAEKKVSLG